MTRESPMHDDELGETLAPLQQHTVRAGGHVGPALALLDALRAGEAGGVALGEVIGRGGMGTVHAATQPALGRSVAVKVPREGAEAADLAGMVSEAIITGGLEHPAVVPVHALHVDAAGWPRLVLKRIEGESWAAVLDREDPEARSEARLVEHLRVWLRVSEALRFAHSRGIIHRDVKPDNVMVGAFGEVYLLDWGIAVRVGEGDPRIPRLDRENASAGTPGFAAPEQALGQVDRQGPATDVYLLGATLFAVLCGRMPHAAPTPVAMMVSSARGTAGALPAWVDARLARLCEAALAVDPAARPTVGALAEQLERWIASRSAWRLLDEAAGQVAALESAAAEGGGDRRRWEAAFDAVRATLGQVGALVDADEVARLSGRAAVAIAEIALADGDPDSAERRLALPGAQIEAADRQRLTLAVHRARRAADMQASLAAARDPTVGRRARARLMLVFGVFAVGLPLSGALTGELPPVRTAGLGNIALGVFCLTVFLAAWSRLGRTVPNRLVLLAFMTSTVALGVLDLWAATLALPADEVYRLHLLFFVVAGAILAVGVDGWLWPVPVVYAVLAAVASVRPGWVMGLTAIGHGWLTVNATWVWLQGARGDAAQRG